MFEEQVRWTLSDAVPQGVSEHANYSSVGKHSEAVQKLFEAEQQLGWMVELSDQEAHRRYPGRLHVAALAVVEEKKKSSGT